MDGQTFGPRVFSAVSPVTIRTCPTPCVTDEDLEDCVATHVSGGETGPPRQTKQALCMLGGGSLKPRSAFKETRGGRRRDWLDGAKKCLSVCVGSIEMVWCIGWRAHNNHIGRAGNEISRSIPQLTMTRYDSSSLSKESERCQGGRSKKIISFLQTIHPSQQRKDPAFIMARRLTPRAERNDRSRSQGHRWLGPSVGRSLLWGKQPREAPPPPQPHPETVRGSPRRGGGPKLKVKERIRIRMDRGGGFDIGASERGTFALVVGLLKVKFVSGGTRFMSRKFRETKPTTLRWKSRNLCGVA